MQNNPGNADIQTTIRLNITPEELKKEIRKYDGLIIRSSTKSTSEIIEKATKLRAICRAGVGIDNVDVSAATKKGIIVMNTPGGNTTSTAEHTITLLLALSRNIPQACNSVREGKWERKKFMGIQVSGKILGIIGLGKIGKEVARRATALEMRVLGYDPFISSETISKLNIHLVKNLDELLKQSDYITLHIPLRNDTKNIISNREFALMKDGVRIINCARGGIISEDALYDALVSGKVAGAAMDVFEKEPPENNKLLELDNVIPTPHLGSLTDEAQYAVARDAAEQMVDALKDTNIRNAVNMPVQGPEELQQLKPYITLTEKMGTLLIQLVRGRIKSIDVQYSGEVSKNNVRPLTDSLLVGLLRHVLDEDVNIINARILADERGIKINEIISSAAEDYTNLIFAKTNTDNGENSVSGTIFKNNEPKIETINDYRVDMDPIGHVLILVGQDKPGLIGRVGKILGDNKINIGHMTFGRKESGGGAMIVINVDALVPQEILSSIENLKSIKAAYMLKF
ncbi:MAG: D-3-phosphoglycerate dehydrogenase (PGDH) [Candidatus Scalindua rubra]|uniref:D-3-phosphoglycerate dehydrogenase n=1 Tax=Candidatus Scalindua rubra TaxID=1872076 RepID=A0A1E3XCW2_9BACT|nr:MAG: D-3-phosphoglycerate dehydrogenase (PGDH) [Candidatus Scalindua rubra]